METPNTFEKITVTNDHKPTPHDGWEKEGVLLLPQFVPHDLIDRYVEERKKKLWGTEGWRPGWKGATEYCNVQSMREVSTYRPLTQKISEIIGSEPGLHLCLTGFQSTERAWHQDRYLNPENVGERYIAAWIALDDIHPDSGPFEYVPGSHLWPVIERKRVWEEMKRRGQRFDKDTWPSDSQGWVGEACQSEIARRGNGIKSFIGKKGDVLLWHASLLHRGSLPKNKSLERRALISHYSAVDSRPEWKRPYQLRNGSFVFFKNMKLVFQEKAARLFKNLA